MSSDINLGIGGMAAALALGLRGHHVTILESAPKLMEVGAGIQASPNMLRLFDRWGVSSMVHAKDIALESITIRRWEDGAVLSTMPVNKAYGQQTVVHRADLHNALITKALALENVRLKVNSRVTGIKSYHPAAVALMDGTVVTGDVVVAADGIKSVLRGEMLGSLAMQPIPTGDAAYRIMLSREVMEQDPELKALLDSPSATRWIGPHRHVIAYPVRNHDLLNIVLLHPDDHEAEESWTTTASKQTMLRQYHGWDPRLLKLLDLVKEDEVLEWKLCSYPSLNLWTKGHIALLGDACHPMLPYVAQGAAQAVEDAAALAILLSIIPSRHAIPEALRAYEMSRKPRAEAIQQSGMANRTILHLPDGPEQEARDKQFLASRSSAANPDKWADAETQKLLWGWDAEEHALATWSENMRPPHLESSL
ncbi:putative salicylate hydroxylase [Aspergillus flavus AF70]|nr:putative salicylate hydroxylase [Aspergillus flavus AF70]